MKKIIQLLATCGLLTCGAAHAEWISTGGGSLGGKTYVSSFIDPATIKRTPERYVVRRAWILHDITNPAKGDPRSGRYLMEYDCSNESFRTIQSSQFSEPMGSGRSTSSGLSKQNWMYAEPETNTLSDLKFVCEYPLP
jgi:hypothetical protein